MKKLLLLLVLIAVDTLVYPQNYDLIVKTNGDSIACKIDTVSDTSIYFEMRYNNKWMPTNISKNEVLEYKFNVIDKDLVIFKKGTSYIDKFAADANLVKALKLNKTGKILIYTGAGAIAGGSIFPLLASNADMLTPAGLYIGSAVFFVGIGFEIVGIPMTIINSKKIKRFNSTAFNYMHIDLKPDIQHNIITGNYRPGLILRISF